MGKLVFGITTKSDYFEIRRKKNVKNIANSELFESLNFNETPKDRSYLCR